MTFDSSLCSEQFGMVVHLTVFAQFLTIAISFSCYFYNVTLTINKKFMQIALLEPTPFRKNVPVSFLQNLTQIIFNDSIKQNQQQASKID